MPKKSFGNWPVYFKERLILRNPNSPVGVVTLWLPKENVIDHLSGDSFSVCGQLYTKGGINYIVRNILANPKICRLIMCGVDRQGSGEALKLFFENGVEPEKDTSGKLISWKVIGDTKVFLDPQIPMELINKVREAVKLYDYRTFPLEEMGSKVKKTHEKSMDSKPFCDPVILPEAEKTTANVFPSDRSVYKIRRDYIGEAWIDILKTVTRFGQKIPGMYGEVSQVQNLSVVIEKEDPDDPQMESYFNFDGEQLKLYYKGFFSRNENQSEVYTYGERIFDWNGIDQEKIMVEKLKRYEHDRGVMAVLWKPEADNFPLEGIKISKMKQTEKWRVPCLVMILGQVSNGKFDMTAVFRNNDVYGAWPLNSFALRKFQKNIAQKAGLGLGILTTISHIAEIYNMNFDDALKIVHKEDTLSRNCQNDPRGYYIVNREGDEIVVTFYSPDGLTELGTYRKDGLLPKSARDLCAEILKDLLVSDNGAACDLGRQLAKAEAAIKLGLHFEQDQPLKFPDQDL